MALNNPMKSRRWNGSNLSKALRARFRVLGHDHFLDRQLPLGAVLRMLKILEEHMFGAA